jgi:GNAT superfamily N-acetyltransferase
MIETKVFSSKQKAEESEKKEIVEFLFQHLEEYGDPIKDIEKCYDYAMKEFESFGGFILVSYESNEMVGAVIVNSTGMKGYIPENILVYIATHKDYRGKGVGKHLMNKAAELADGDIALHVEATNPARFLYEKVGFQTKYNEMRLIRKK